VFVGWSTMAEDVLDSPTFSARMRELVVLHVAYLQGSSYEIVHHRFRGGHAGISPHQLDAITSHGDLAAAGFDDAELDVLQFVTELCTTNHVCDNTFAAARVALGGDGAITELLMLVSLYYGLALVLNAAELELDDTVRLPA
jgi:4-carboxymuconolactone decarboxylase